MVKGFRIKGLASIMLAGVSLLLCGSTGAGGWNGPLSEPEV